MKQQAEGESHQRCLQIWPQIQPSLREIYEPFLFLFFSDRTQVLHVVREYSTVLLSVRKVTQIQQTGCNLHGFYIDQWLLGDRLAQQATCGRSSQQATYYKHIVWAHVCNISPVSVSPCGPLLTQQETSKSHRRPGPEHFCSLFHSRRPAMKRVLIHSSPVPCFIAPFHFQNGNKAPTPPCFSRAKSGTSLKFVRPAAGYSNRSFWGKGGDFHFAARRSKMSMAITNWSFLAGPCPNLETLSNVTKPRLLAVNIINREPPRPGLWHSTFFNWLCCIMICGRQQRGLLSGSDTFCHHVQHSIRC